ncbi:MAG: SDR family oxidoreductase [Allosphingosinicella sp.]|uniref:SDR family oxidoreductase n=1 Tax=Allosphingosinicella sp. TaxID=2823234 RepID=UPI00394C91A0
MNDHPFSLAGQTVLVVGASSGIGAATSALANRLGARVILSSRSADALAKVQAELDHPAEADVVAFDYRDVEAVRLALSPFERIDHVVIPAVADENKKRGAFLELDDATMRASFDKFWGQVNVLRAAVPKMPAGGSATLFASIAGLKPTGKDAGLSVMNGVQAAVIQTGRSLAVELAPVRVNVIAPGVVLTNVWNDVERANLADWMERTLPARRAGLPEDLAKAAVSLIANPYVTGAVLTVDGGLHLV